VLRASSWCLALLVAGSLWACRSSSERPERPEPPPEPLSAPSVSASAASSRAADTGASRRLAREEATRAVIEIRQRLPLRAPTEAPRRLAFGHQFLLQLAESEVVVRKSRDGAIAKRVPFGKPLALVELAVGHVLVVGAANSLWFEPQLNARVLPRLRLLPGYRLTPARESFDHVWVIPSPTPKAWRYALQSPGLEPERELDLPGYAGGPLCSLSDGSFAHVAGNTIVHTPVRGASSAHTLPAGIGRPWRLAPAFRIDQVWLVDEGGELFLLSLQKSAKVALRVASGIQPLDFARTSKHLALLGSVETATGPRSLRLAVYTTLGERVFERTLPASEPSTTVDWEAKLQARHQVALAENPPRAAVGGVEQVQLFDFASDQEIQPPADRAAGSAGVN